VVNRVVSRFGAFRGLRTIELGAGRGDLSVLFARRGADVTLLDCNDRALTAARQRFARLGLEARFEKADLTGNLAASLDRFDVSLSAGVIEHFKGADRTAVLRAHRDVLAPGGMTIVSVPNSWCVPYRIWKAYLGLRGWWPYGMEIPYSKTEITRRALAAGFDRVETHGLHLLQSVGDHWVKRLSNRSPRWANRSCMLDRWMGSILLMFGWIDPGGENATAWHSRGRTRTASTSQPGKGN
jgi:cyclopropane fatty-acyl-phospholipid synthase-like methyltransferase